MYNNFGNAIEGLFYAFFIAIAAALLLAGYVFWSALWGTTNPDWTICGQMSTDAAKVECMEAAQ